MQGQGAAGVMGPSRPRKTQRQHRLSAAQWQAQTTLGPCPAVSALLQLRLPQLRLQQRRPSPVLAAGQRAVTAPAMAHSSRCVAARKGWPAKLRRRAAHRAVVSAPPESGWLQPDAGQPGSPSRTRAVPARRPPARRPPRCPSERQLDGHGPEATGQRRPPRWQRRPLRQLQLALWPHSAAGPQPLRHCAAEAQIRQRRCRPPPGRSLAAARPRNPTSRRSWEPCRRPLARRAAAG